MITLALLKHLSDQNTAGLELDQNAFWEEAPLQKDGKPASGVWFITRSGIAYNSPKGGNLKTTIDIYVAKKNKLETEKVHQDLLIWILKNPSICTLKGEMGGFSYNFENIRIKPTTTPENAMITENGLIVKMASVELTYDIKLN